VHTQKPPSFCIFIFNVNVRIFPDVVDYVDYAKCANVVLRYTLTYRPSLSGDFLITAGKQFIGSLETDQSADCVTVGGLNPSHLSSLSRIDPCLN